VLVGRRARALADQPPVKLKQNDAQSLVVGSGLIVAAEKVPVKTREDLINCTLFAQLAASGEVEDPTQVSEWYDAYFRALTALGWAQSDTQFEDYEFSSQNAEAHKAIIPVLMALLGPQAAALAVIKAALDGLHSMQENSPWITLFDQQSRTEKSARFQVATAQVDADGLLQISLVAFHLKARTALTQVLFFKFASSSTRLRYSAGRATIYEAALREMRGVLATRLAEYRSAYVGQVKFAPLPGGGVRSVGKEARTGPWKTPARKIGKRVARRRG
jgi:hypothetical protein